MNTKIAFALALLISSSAFAASGLGGMRRTKSHAVLGLADKTNRSFLDEALKTSSVHDQLLCFHHLILTAMAAGNQKNCDYLRTQLEEFCTIHKINFEEQSVQIQQKAVELDVVCSAVNVHHSDDELEVKVGSFGFDFEL